MTKESKRLLREMYNLYLVKRQNGNSRQTAKDFGRTETVQKDCAPSWSIDDVDDCLRELTRLGYLSSMDKTKPIYHCWLTDVAISDLEQYEINVIKDVASFIAQFSPWKFIGN